MAGTVIDNLTIDLSLNIDEFNRKADAARARLVSTFADASKDAKSFTSVLKKIETEWNKSKDYKAVSDLIAQLREASAQTSTVRSAVIQLQDTFNKASRTNDFSQVASAIDTVREAIKAARKEAKQAKYDGLAYIDQQVKERKKLADDIQKQAEAATAGSIQPESSKLDRLSRSSDLASEKVKGLREEVLELTRQYSLLLSQADAVYKRLADVTKQRDSLVSERGLSVDERTGLINKPEGADQALSQAVTEANRAYKEAEKDVANYEKSLASLLSKIESKNEAIKSKTEAATKAQERYNDAQEKSAEKQLVLDKQLLDLRAKLQTEKQKEEEELLSREANIAAAIERRRNSEAEALSTVAEIREEAHAKDLPMTQEEIVLQGKLTEAIITQEEAYQRMEDAIAKAAEAEMRYNEVRQKYLDTVPSDDATFASASPEDRAAWTRLAEEVKQAKEEFDKLDKAAKAAVSTFERAETVVDNTTAGISKAVKKNVSATIKELEQQVKEVDDSINKLSTSIGAILTSLGITKSLKDAIEAAGKAEKAIRRLSNVYGEFASDARVAASELADAYGMSNTAAASTLGYISNLMTAYGLEKRAALDLSQGIVALGADLASFSGGTKTAEQAVQSLSQALLGNYRATRDLGIAINDTEVKAMARSMNMATDSLTQAELAMLRYQVILEQTKNVQGDFIRNQDTHYAMTQRYKAAIDDLRVSFGEELLPAINAGLELLIKFSEGLSTFSPEIKAITVSLGVALVSFVAFSAVIRPLITNLKYLKIGLAGVGASGMVAKTGIDATTASALKLNAALSASKIGMILSIIAGVVALIGTFSNAAEKSAKSLDDYRDSVDDLTASLNKYETALKRVNEASKDGETSAVNLYGIDKEREAFTSALDKAITNYNKLQKSSEKTTKAYEEEQSAREQVLAMYRKGLDSQYLSIAAQNNLKSQIYELEDAYLAAAKTYEATMSKNKTASSEYILAITSAYMEQQDITEDLLKDEEDLLAIVKQRAFTLQWLSQHGFSQDAMADMNYDRTDWEKEIESINSAIEKQTIKRLESEGEYREALQYTIKELDKEAEVRKKGIEDAIKAQERLFLSALPTEKLSEEYFNTFRENMEDVLDKVENGVDVAEINLDFISEEDPNFNTDKIRTLLDDLAAYYRWYGLSREKIENDYADNVYKSNEKLQDKLIALQSKSAYTIGEQLQVSLDKQKEAYKKYIDELTASFGGSKGIIGDMATEEDILNFKRAVESVKNGVRATFTEDEFFRVTTTIGDTEFEGEKAKEFFMTLMKLYDAYAQGRLNIEEQYNKKVADAQAKQQQDINTLNATLSRDRQKIHQAELDNLEIEKQQRIDNAKTSGEDIALIEEEFRLKRLESEQDFIRETADMRRDANISYLQQMKGMTTDLYLIYNIEKQLLDDELQYELSHAEETGKDKLAIRREYALKEIQLEREKEDAIREEQKRNFDFWNYGNVSQDGDFLNAAVNSYFQMDQEFTERFRQAKQDLEMAISEDWGALFSEYAGTDMEGPLKQIQDAFLTAADDKDLLGIRTLIDNLKDTKPELYEAINKIIPEDAWDKTEERNKQRAKALANIITSTITSTLSAINDLLSSVEDSEMNYIKRRIEVMKDEYNAFKEQVEARNDKSYKNLTRSQKDAIERQKKLDEEELERQKSLIESQEDLLKNQQNEQFERQKAFSIASATITGIMAAINAYSGGMAMAPFLGIGAAAAPALAAGMMAASLATTAAQIAMIANQQVPSYAQGAYNLPQDQTGVNVHKGELIVPRPFAEEIREHGGFLTGDALSGSEVIVNVYGATDEVSVEASEAENTKQLDIYLTKRVKTMVVKGELDTALQSRYVLSRQGRRS